MLKRIDCETEPVDRSAVRLTACSGRLIERSKQAGMNGAQIECVKELCHEFTQSIARDVCGDPEDAASALDELTELLTECHSSIFNQFDRFHLTIDALSMLADPSNTVLQGLRNTCGAAIAAYYLASGFKSVFANLIRQVAATGRYFLPGGQEVFLNPASLRPAEDRFLSSFDIPRFANHVVQYTLANLSVQALFGNDCRYLRVRLLSGRDTGERVMDMKSGQILCFRRGDYFFSDPGSISAQFEAVLSPTLTAVDHQMILSLVTYGRAAANHGCRPHLFIHKDLEEKDEPSCPSGIPVRSQGELASRLSSLISSREMCTVLVSLIGKPFNQGIPLAYLKGRHHLVSVISMDGSTVNLLDPWNGIKSMSVKDLFDSMPVYDEPEPSTPALSRVSLPVPVQLLPYA